MKMRNRSVAACLIIAATIFAAPRVLTAASPDPVREWNQLALKTVRVKITSDARAARLYAMVDVAMYDAVNGIVSQLGAHNGRGYALVPPTGAPAEGDLNVAAAVAAYTVLAGEFPDLKTGFPDSSPGYDAQLQDDLLAMGTVGRNSAADQWGTHVGNRVRELRTGDVTTLSQTAISPTCGKFANAWSGFTLAPFAIVDPSSYIGSGPLPVTSLNYAGAFAEVKLIGDGTILNDGGTDNGDTFRFWSLGAGTDQPPGEWLKIALAVTADNPPPLPEMTRLFALLSMAMADTVSPVTLTKRTYRHWRPEAAIKGADACNAYTVADPSWTPRGATPGSPESFSGHSAFASAGAAALAGFFCSDNAAFSLLTDSGAQNGLAARNYSSFSAAAAEMGRSRPLGGFHFEFSNQQGLAAGRAIASEVLANKLLRRSGATHFGQCPL